MAQYAITHSCGHDATYRLGGPMRERERKLQWLYSKLCRECEALPEVELRRRLSEAADKRAQRQNATPESINSWLELFK